MSSPLARMSPEIVACVVGQGTGQASRLDPKRTQRIGEYIGMAVITGAGVAVTLVNTSTRLSSATQSNQCTAASHLPAMCP